MAVFAEQAVCWTVPGAKSCVQVMVVEPDGRRGALVRNAFGGHGPGVLVLEDRARWRGDRLCLSDDAGAFVAGATFFTNIFRFGLSGATPLRPTILETEAEALAASRNGEACLRFLEDSRAPSGIVLQRNGVTMLLDLLTLVPLDAGEVRVGF